MLERVNINYYLLGHRDICVHRQPSSRKSSGKRELVVKLERTVVGQTGESTTQITPELLVFLLLHKDRDRDALLEPRRLLDQNCSISSFNDICINIIHVAANIVSCKFVIQMVLSILVT